MIIKKDTVAEVVKEASTKMTDPNYSAVMVGGFVQEQPHVAQYISASATELGGAEAVASVVFHAALIGLCFQRGYKRSVRRITFDDMDHVSDGDRDATLTKQQPFIKEFLEQNVEHPEARRVLTLIALAMEWVS